LAISCEILALPNTKKRFTVLVLELPLAKQLGQIEFSLIFTVSPVKNDWKAILYRGGRSVLFTN
jgi:hypothetical protein